MVRASHLVSLLVVLLIAQVSEAKWSRRRVYKVCQQICEDLTMYIQINADPLDTLKEYNTKEYIENFCKTRSLGLNSPCKLFREHSSGIHTTIMEGRYGKSVCRKTKLCKAYIDQRQERKGNEKSTSKTCKICKKVIVVVKSGLSFLNKTLFDAGETVKLVCQTFFAKAEAQKKCFKIVDQEDKIEAMILANVESKKICEAIKLCNTTRTEEETQEGASAWSLALSAARMLGDEKGTPKDDTIRSKFFETLADVTKEFKAEARKDAVSRKRRSAEGQCDVCSAITKMAMGQLAASNKILHSLPGRVSRICSSISSEKARHRCAVIYSLTSTTQFMLRGIMPSGICKEKHCLPRDTRWILGLKTKRCSICKAVTSIIRTEVKFVVETVHMILKEVDTLCSQYATETGQKECKTVTKILDSISKSVADVLSDKNMCQKLTLC